MRGEGGHQVAIECKLLETGVGACSRPSLTPDDPEYEVQFCNGSYAYDNRNPDFQASGRGQRAFEQTRDALRDRSSLRKCSWQVVLVY